MLPVSPSEYEIEHGQKANSLTMHETGDVNLPGPAVLIDREIKCMLPSQAYPFNQPGAILNPFVYLKKLEKWSDAGTVLRFVISDTPVNATVILDPIRYREQDGTNDIYCTIPLRGYRELKAEAIARKLCGDFGVPVGELEETRVPVTRNFPGKSLYSMIQTAYTEASAQTGEKYMVRFRGEKLDVIAKRPGPETLVLEAGSNLINATVTESVENMTNQVAILDDKGNQVGVQSNAEAMELYGLMQSVLTKSKDEDPVKEAKRMLEDGELSQKITVENLGNPALIAGNCCVLRESSTGLYGLFWIDSDTHTWKNGLYQNKLILNFRNIMDEQEAGQLVRA